MSATRMLVSCRQVQRSVPRQPSAGSVGPVPDAGASRAVPPSVNSSAMPSGR
ncbi:hypothetical protein L600_001100000760 [Isoptericola variabilis J7]|uniref:hypothetical protein n=1 Tax=Isoptericola variabilis TaxID=139208 RepID=UPI0011AE04FE|nr:hypothetical protein [Isoptericola variabilis]TWH34594.1 hypothetical protein L600_001100000760 [Isoptericola variabilis J7]